MLNKWLSCFTIMLMILCRHDLSSYFDVCVCIIVMMFISDVLLSTGKYWLLMFASVWVSAGVQGKGVVEVERVSFLEGDKQMGLSS